MQHPLSVRLWHHLWVTSLSKPLVPVCPLLHGFAVLSAQQLSITGRLRCAQPLCSPAQLGMVCCLPHAALAAREASSRHVVSSSAGPWPCSTPFAPSGCGQLPTCAAAVLCAPGALARSCSAPSGRRAAFGRRTGLLLKLPRASRRSAESTALLKGFLSDLRRPVG